jgi:hypothetical protein
VTFEEGTWAAWLNDLLKPYVTNAPEPWPAGREVQSLCQIQIPLLIRCKSLASQQICSMRHVRSHQRQVYRGPESYPNRWPGYLDRILEARRDVEGF